jgi:hypothetical protein
MNSGTDTPSTAPQRLDMYSVRCPACNKVTQMDDVHTCSPQQEQAARFVVEANNPFDTIIHDEGGCPGRDMPFMSINFPGTREQRLAYARAIAAALNASPPKEAK